MHKQKLSVFTALVLGATITFGGTNHVWAQDGNPAPPAGNQAQGKRVGAMKRILTELNLTDDQKKQVEPIVKEAGEQQKATRKDDALTPEQKRAKNKEIMTGLREKLEPLLNEEQKTKLNEILKPRGKGRKAKA